MSNEPWIDNYDCRKWAAYAVQPDAVPPLADAMDEFVVYGADSQLAAEAYNSWQARGGKGEPPQFFFFDMEQLLGADRDSAYGLCQLGRLTSKWNGHPPGSLVMVTCEGVDKGNFTCLVALP